MVKTRKLRWYGHISRSSGMAKTILQGTVKGARRTGRQNKRWEDKVWTGMEFGYSIRAAEDRERWKCIVATSSVAPLRPSRLRDWDEPIIKMFLNFPNVGVRNSSEVSAVSSLLASYLSCTVGVPVEARKQHPSEYMQSRLRRPDTVVSQAISRSNAEIGLAFLHHRRPCHCCVGEQGLVYYCAAVA